MTTREHNITVHVDLATHSVLARQMNRRVDLSPDQTVCIRRIAREHSLSSFNIPPASFGRLYGGNLGHEQVTPHPVPVFFVSSYGLLNGSTWTSNQPSEGIWVLAEWLCRNVPEAAPICIDPNLLGRRELDAVLDRFGDGRALLGFSVLPVNLSNDAELICHVKAMLPDSLAIVGGVGSESLALLSTDTGNRGIDSALPVDLILPGSPVLELEGIVRAIYAGTAHDRETLRSASAKIARDLILLDLTRWRSMPDEIQRSRQVARAVFIPTERADLVHSSTYDDANQAAVRGDAISVVSVLINNECSQGCFFCASPKTKVIASLSEAVRFIAEKSRSAQAIAFNDNDLSNHPAGTIALCEAMIDAGIMHPKHGKMRADRHVPALLQALSRANFVRIAVGVESFSQEVRNRLGKANFQLSTIDATLGGLLRAGIRPEINLILFTPAETTQTLRETTERALYWVHQGAWVYVTAGLFATPNSPGVTRLLQTGKETHRIRFTNIHFEGMRASILFPTQWKMSAEMESLSASLLTERRTIITELARLNGVPVSVPIEAYTMIAQLSHRFRLDGFASRAEMMQNVHDYASRESGTHYVSI